MIPDHILARLSQGALEHGLDILKMYVIRDHDVQRDEPEIAMTPLQVFTQIAADEYWKALTRRDLARAGR